jgi:hypothetical protein
MKGTGGLFFLLIETESKTIYNVVDVRQKKIKSGKRCHLKQVTDLFSLKICNPVCCG